MDMHGGIGDWRLDLRSLFLGRDLGCICNADAMYCGCGCVIVMGGWVRFVCR